METQIEVLDAFLRRWHGIRGVTATSDDAPTFARLLDRYGPVALSEVLSQLDLGGLYGIHRPLQYLIGGLRRWEHSRRQQDLEHQRIVAAVMDTLERVSTEEARKQQISLSPKAQYQLMAELWRMAMAMTQQGVLVEEKERRMTAMAQDATQAAKES